MFIEAKDVVSS